MCRSRSGNEHCCVPVLCGEARILRVEVKNLLENPGIDPGTSHMLSERSTT